MNKVKRVLATTSLAGVMIALIGAGIIVQLMVHDPRHVLLISLATWGVMSLPVGLLVGHCALSED